MTNIEVIKKQLNIINQSIQNAEITNNEGEVIDIESGINQSLDIINNVQKNKNQIFFIGNGGSAGISSHLAIDYLKNGGVNSRALNDSSSLTCLANDFGYEFVFSKQIDYYANEDDLVIAISSSGESKNILNGIDSASKKNCSIITLSGFKKDNSLRSKGMINFYINHHDYGVVEVAHLTLLHLILDIKMGLVK
tara:strand:+ start:55 stop:636 length:582 start_codon:yes stop_codon:yes gene_type:complete